MTDPRAEVEVAVEMHSALCGEDDACSADEWTTALSAALAAHDLILARPAPPSEGLREAAQKVLTEFDYWASEPRPAIDHGTVRLHNFREVQPEMERALARLRAALTPADPSAAKETEHAD